MHTLKTNEGILYQVEKQSFTQDGSKYEYHIYHCQQITGELGRTGDTAEEASGKVWYKDNVWKEVPEGCFPKHPTVRGRKLLGMEWKACTKAVFKRKRAESDMNEPREQSTVRDSEMTRNQENMWIVEVYKKWNSPSISPHTTHPVGKEILEELLYSELPISKRPVDGLCMTLLGPPERTGLSPSLAALMQDIIDAQDIHYHNFSKDSGAYLTKGEFMAAWSNNLADPSAKIDLVAVTQVNFTHKGLGGCHFLLPDKGCVGGDWTSTLTSPGCITHPHVDYYGSRQYLVHFKGDKLWLLWPPTEKNLAWYRERHLGVMDHRRTLLAIRELEGLQTCLFSGVEEAFVLNPHVIHACISISVCGHSGVPTCQLSHYGQSVPFMKWGVDWIKSGPTRGLSILDIRAECELFLEEMKWWKSIKTPKHREGMENHKRMLREVGQVEKSIKHMILDLGGEDE